MQEIGVTRCGMLPEMGKFYRIFEHAGKMICLSETEAFRSGFNTDVREMCWITQTGVRTEMTADERAETVRQIKAWNKHAKRQGKLAVRFVDKTKGVYRLSPQGQKLLGLLMGLAVFGGVCALLIFLF